MVIQLFKLTVNIAGVNVQPQGVSIAPTLIAIGPYDTAVAGMVGIAHVV